MTLIEVMIAVAVLSIIIVALGNAMITVSKNTDETTRRLGESHDLQLAAAYFAQDVEAVGVRNWAAAPFPLDKSIMTNVAGTAGPYACGDATAAIVRLMWDDPTSAPAGPQVVRVAYIVRTVDGERQLHRVACVGPGGPVEITLVRNLDSADPAVECLNPNACDAAPNVPQSVRLTLQIRDPRRAGAPLIVTLTGQRRQT